MIKKGDIFAINYASLHYWDKGKQYIEPADGGGSYCNGYDSFV